MSVKVLMHTPLHVTFLFICRKKYDALSMNLFEKKNIRLKIKVKVKKSKC